MLRTVHYAGLPEAEMIIRHLPVMAAVLRAELACVVNPGAGGVWYSLWLGDLLLAPLMPLRELLVFAGYGVPSPAVNLWSNCFPGLLLFGLAFPAPVTVPPTDAQPDRRHDIVKRAEPRCKRSRRLAPDLLIESSLLGADAVRGLVDDWIIPAAAERVIRGLTDPPLPAKEE